jgi:4-hydroxy-tetrahydrodipicolinate synthase
MPSPAAAQPPFGRVLTAMITPFRADGGLDLDGVQRLATLLVDAGNQGLVVNGTTGESPTTTDAEKDAVLRATLEAVGDRAHVIAGTGTNDTRHTIEMSQAAEKAGAHGLLVVTPYYNKPPQAGLVAHFTAVADSTGLPVVLYDIPHRTGVAIEGETLVRLAEHPRIVANKDAKGDIVGSSWVMSRCGLVYYSGDDVCTLPLMSVGAVGVISVAGHLVAERLVEMVDAYAAGQAGRALALHRELLPVFQGLFKTQGVILTKAALNALGLPAGPVRPPLVDVTATQLVQLRLDLAEGLVAGFTA